MPEIAIRGLTLKQPWAWAVAHLGKDVENRTWQTHYRGLIAIHAGMTTEYGVIMPFPAAIRAHINAQRDDSPDLKVRGAIVAVALLHDCHLDAKCTDLRTGRVGFCSPWAQRDSWHWRLKVTAVTEPVPCRGALGLWNLPDDVDELVRARLPRGEVPHA